MATSTWSETRENVRLVIEALGIVALALGALSAFAAYNAANSAVEQINQSKYQALYEQQLTIWQKAVEDGRLAMLVTGKPDEASAKEAVRRFYALDYYAYVYAQQAPQVDPGGQVAGLAINSSVVKPDSVTSRDWSSWESWSRTISDAFYENHSLCAQLADDWFDYDKSFRFAIKRAYYEDEGNKRWLCVSELAGRNS